MQKDINNIIASNISSAEKSNLINTRMRDVKAYLELCCGKKLDEKALIRSMKPYNLSVGDGSYYVVVLWAEGKFNKIVPNEFVETKTISELIDILAGK